MNSDRLNIYSNLLLDSQLQLIKAENIDNRLFFGVNAENKIGCLVFGLLENSDGRNSLQLDAIIESIYRALSEKRNVYLKYISYLPDNRHVHVAAYALYVNDDSVCLQASEIDEADLRRVYEQDAHSFNQRSKANVRQTIYENLPIGVEVYNRDGKLIEVNPAEMEVMGVRAKEDVLGLDLFKNPNISDDIKSRLRSGEDVHFTAKYDFDLASKEYYDTAVSKIRHFDVDISVIRNENDEIDKYLLISQNITAEVLLQQKYENLYNQTMTILNSLPVGIEVYDTDGNLLFLNETDCRIFGVERDLIMSMPVNINQNPNLPESVKNAARTGAKICTHFPYKFSAVAEEKYYETAKTLSIQIRCNGTPVINESGQIENYVFIVEDVTETVLAEEELRESKRKTELSMKAADIVLWEFDVQTYLFTTENDPLNGYDQTKLLTVEAYLENFHVDDRLEAYGIINAMLQGEDHLFNLDMRIKYPGNSEWQYCTTSGAPYEKDANGKVLKYVGFRRNNTALHKKKMLQEKILNNIPLPIQIKDIENNYRYVFCNEESKLMFGNCEGKSVYDVWDEKSVERFLKNDVDVFKTGKSYFGEQRVVLKDGRTYDTIVRKNIVEDAGKRLLLCVYWDQSLQNELDRRSKVLSISMNTMNAYTWYYDSYKDQLSYGEGFERIGKEALGVDSLEKFASHIHPDDRQRFLYEMAQILELDKDEFALEYRIDLLDKGNYEWWECRGVLETIIQNDIPYKYLFGMDINIESHKQTELTLLKNKEALNKLIRQNELVLNNTNSGLAYITMDYIVQWENISMCSASLSYEAYKKGELCYKSAYNRTEPCENCVMKRVMQSRQMEQIQFRLNNKRIVEIFSTPVFDKENNIDGVVIRVDDVTEREQMIEELKRAKSLAEQSDKLKSAFLANMSHEIRTPLNAIVGFSDLLMDTMEADEKKEYIQIIHNNNELLLKLINDILDLSKIEAGSVELKYEEFDLSEFFNGIFISMRQRLMKQDIELICTNPYKKCFVKLDKNRITQILTNYLTNAIKYTPKGFVEMGYEQEDGGIRFYVKDSGIGISEEKKNKVFHRFEKLDEFAQGTGLGLSICKAIAESMNGTVGFESKYEKGSTFWAFLPCNVDEGTEAVSPINENDNLDVSDSSDISRKTILVVEDISSNYLLVEVLLRKHFELLHAVNGKEAVEMVKTDHPDLLLMDMKMPQMDGLTAAAEIRKFNQEIPIVALTAHAFESDRLAALAAGCNEYLVKPIDKAKLMSLLRKYGCFTPPVVK